MSVRRQRQIKWPPWWTLDVVREADPGKWPWDVVETLMSLFKPTIERDTGGHLHRMEDDLGSGAEGRVVGGTHSRLGAIVLKIGWPWEVTDPGRQQLGAYSDYVVAAQVADLDLPGIARVYGVWRHEGTKAHAILRERVDTDHEEAARALGVSNLDMEDALIAVHRDAASICVKHGGDAALACYVHTTMRVGAILPALQVATKPVLDAVEALAQRGIYVGADLNADNLGWRATEAGPKLVVIDLGSSIVMGRPRAPRVANPRERLRHTRSST